jgi:hypothetical protein
MSGIFEKLIAAMEENTAVQKALLAKIEGAKPAVAAADAADADAEKPARRGRKSNAEKEAEKAAEKPAVDAGALAKAWLDEVPVEYEEVTNEDGEIVEEPVDSEENEKLVRKRKRRFEWLKKAAARLKVKKIGDLTGKDVDTFVKWLEAKKAGDDPLADEDED